MNILFTVRDAQYYGVKTKIAMPKSPHKRPFEPHQKKATLKSAEARLLHAIKQEFNSEKTKWAAEAVRTAHLYLIESRQKLLQHDFHNPQWESERTNLERDHQLWSELPITKIIEKYEKSLSSGRGLG